MPLLCLTRSFPFDYFRFFMVSLRNRCPLSFAVFLTGDCRKVPAGECTKKNLPVCSFPILNSTRAFTLLEVMIAVSIIAIALVALFGSQSRSLSQATEAHFNVVAPMLASGKLAELVAATDTPMSDEGDFGEEFPGYRWKIETDTAIFDGSEVLTNLEKLENPLQKVELTVLWSESTFQYVLTYYGRWQK
jgi:general secretion pathway protein I